MMHVLNRAFQGTSKMKNSVQVVIRLHAINFLNTLFENRFRWIASRMMILSILPPWAINLTICALTAVLTQVASNTATANVLLPILAEMAITICVNPIYLIMSAALTASYAFMLPVKLHKIKNVIF